MNLQELVQETNYLGSKFIQPEPEIVIKHTTYPIRSMSSDCKGCAYCTSPADSRCAVCPVSHY